MSQPIDAKSETTDIRTDSRRTVVYVDAMNLYKGLLESVRMPWFDIETFFASEYSRYTNVTHVKYFTSPGQDTLREPLAIYHKALEAAHNPTKLKIFLGKVIDVKKPECTHVPCPLHNMLQATYKEKQTDVSMAVEVVSDVLSPGNPCKKVILITNDSDFVPLIKKVKWLRPKTDVVVLAPVKARSGQQDGHPRIGQDGKLKSRPGDWICQELKATADSYFPLRNHNIGRYRLPDIVIAEDGTTFECPERFRR